MNFAKPLVISNSSKSMRQDETVAAIKKFMALESVDVSDETEETMNMSDIEKRAIVSDDVLHKLRTIYNIIKVDEIEETHDHDSDKAYTNVKPGKKRKSLS